MEVTKWLKPSTPSVGANNATWPSDLCPLKVRFAPDSLVEEDRFELPVPPKTPNVLAFHVRADPRWRKSHYLICLAPYEGSESEHSRYRGHREEFRAMKVPRLGGGALQT
jgi:hypothetical protein